MSGSNDYVYASYCPVCGSPLQIDEEVGYRCPDCGWDASVELDDDAEWIVPDDRGDQARLP